MATDTSELDAEIRALAASQWRALTDEPVQRKFMRVFDAVGLSRVHNRALLVLLAERRTTLRLDERDLPGPDQVWRPIIIGEVKDAVGDAIDDVFNGRLWLPT